MTMHEHRPSVEDHEPDYRFTLANERTFLAWVRTALGLLAGGVAVHQLVGPFRVAHGRTALAVGCLILAVVLAVGAYVHWRSVQRAMRRDAPTPWNPLTLVLAAGASGIALFAGAAVLAS